MADISSSSSLDTSLLGSNLASAPTLGRIHGSAGMTGLGKMEIATVLSIAHLSGWSAELIANKVNDHLSTSISAEKVWDTYKMWEDARNETRAGFSTMEREFSTSGDMIGILRQLQMEPDFYARPLSQTPRPISVPFSRLWYPKDDESAVLDEFTEKTRAACLGALLWRVKERDLAKPTQKERHVMNKLGEQVANIMTELLLLWTDEQATLNEQLPFTKVIEVSRENIQTIEKYVRDFEYKWEDIFGKMDGAELIWLPLHTQPPCYHNLSTGDASKNFFGQMLFTRLQAMEKRRAPWRSLIGFEVVPLAKLPADEKDCCICRQPLGVPDEEGKVEMPIQVVACCGNYFGRHCLRRWYEEFDKKRCPLCNWTASGNFLYKLCYREMEDEIDSNVEIEEGTDLTDSVRVSENLPDSGDDQDDAETEIDSEQHGDPIEDNGEPEDGEIKD